MIGLIGDFFMWVVNLGLCKGGFGFPDVGGDGRIWLRVLSDSGGHRGDGSFPEVGDSCCRAGWQKNL